VHSRLLTLAALLLLSAPLAYAAPADDNPMSGQEPTGPSQPTPRLADGHPDFNGYWKGLKEKGKPGGNIGRDLPNFKLPLTPAGEKALTYNREQTIDPESRCILGGTPRHDASGLPFQVLQSSNHVAFLYFYTTYRLVPLDGRPHDPDPDPKFFGDETGHWDGDTLVIDSVGFKDSKDGKFWIDENADPQSEKTHTVERWTRPDRDHIHVHLTVEDPLYYTHPFTFDRTWVLDAKRDLNEFACAENNVDLAHLGPGPGIIGPDGNRGYGQQPVLPKDPPGPEAYQR
jgi:hypothetical protein